MKGIFFKKKFLLLFFFNICIILLLSFYWDLIKLPFSNNNEVVGYLTIKKINPKFLRPEELNYLCGDSAKAQRLLGWKPKYSFESMVDEILEYFLKTT